MRWLELTVTCDNEAIEAVSEILGRVSQGSAVRPTRLIRDPNDELSAREDPSAPYEITAHIPEDEAAPAAVEATERALWHLQAFGLRPVGELQVRSVDDADWTDAWKAGYVPQRIGRVVIVPSWLDEPIGPDEVALRLDPGMAFGTGLHPTTRGCLTLLQEISPMPPVVLDVGSGSGILALAALRLGAERAVCYDTDPLAVEATLANAAANGPRRSRHREPRLVAARASRRALPARPRQPRRRRPDRPRRASRRAHRSGRNAAREWDHRQPRRRSPRRAHGRGVRPRRSALTTVSGFRCDMLNMVALSRVQSV